MASPSTADGRGLVDENGSAGWGEGVGAKVEWGTSEAVICGNSWVGMPR